MKAEVFSLNYTFIDFPFTFFPFSVKMNNNNRDNVKRSVRRACKLQEKQLGVALLQQTVPANGGGKCTTAQQQCSLTTTDGESLLLEWCWGTRLAEADFTWAFGLFRRNMRELYLKSRWGYDERSKRDELAATTSRYLLLRNAQARPVAFAHFRFVEDDDRPVLYCYELQVEPDYQQKGVGTLLIQCLERAAISTRMELMMATVFAFNWQSLAFFHKCGFRTDRTCTFGQSKRDDGPDYVILSKRPGQCQQANSELEPDQQQQQKVLEELLLNMNCAASKQQKTHRKSGGGAGEQAIKDQTSTTTDQVEHHRLGEEEEEN